jgi:DNA-binding LytR/AlgR family response regulator
MMVTPESAIALSNDLKIVAIDDECLALDRLELLLKEVPGTHLIATSTDPDELLPLVSRHRPDLLLLDIEMPGANGIELASRLERLEYPLPLVIYVTAYDHHAVRAFETRAVDYILKPATPFRLEQSIAHARALVEQARSYSQVRELKRRLDEVHTGQIEIYDERDGAEIWAMRGGQFVQLRAGEVEWAESERDYAHIHNSERAYLLRTTLGALHQRLGTDRFVRVRRSAIVRLESIASIRDRGYGEIHILLRSGAEVRVGRTYLKPLRDRLKKWSQPPASGDGR